jgi:outer membrane protein assembly factor BamB
MTAVVGGALALTMSACGREDGPRAETARSKIPAAKDAPHFDPPVRFAPNGRPLLSTATGPDDAGDVAVAGRLAYFQDAEGLRAVDVTTGDPSWSARPGAGATVHGRDIRPAIVSSGGRDRVVGLFPGKLPGHGTTAATPVLEVLVVDPATGRTVGDDALPLPPHLAGEDFTSHQIVGADDQAIVIGLSGSGVDAVVVVDPTARRIRWARRGVIPVAASGGRVVVIGTVRPAGIFGGGTYRLQGIDAMTNAVRWSTAPVSTHTYEAGPAGPTLVALFAGDGADGLLDISTGRRRFRFPDQSVRYDCVHDGRSVTVCHSTHQVLAFDAATARPLWELPKGGRTQPTVTTVWHGAVYGTTANGPVVIDARTGRDRETSPGAAPSLVGPYGAIVEQDHSLVFQAAVG